MKDKHAIGVIVGRFQVPALTDGHKEILEHCLAAGHETNIIVLGIPPEDVRSTKNNPIPYKARAQMLREEYGDRFCIAYVKDVPTDEEWSRNLDRVIMDVTGGDDSVVLYGSRSSFIEHYRGRYDTEVYEQRVTVSGTEVRESAVHSGETSKGFRLGCVFATQRSWAHTFPTVDCAVFSDASMRRLYMGRKRGERLLRFVGGFLSREDASMEEAAVRETREETSLSCRVVDYVGTHRVDDWRYRSEVEGIMTTLYTLVVESGKAEAGDDLAEVELVDLDTLAPEDVNEPHRPLLAMLKEHLEKGGRNNG